jgi:hypothetical protein
MYFQMCQKLHFCWSTVSTPKLKPRMSMVENIAFKKENEGGGTVCTVCIYKVRQANFLF